MSLFGMFKMARLLRASFSEHETLLDVRVMSAPHDLDHAFIVIVELPTNWIPTMELDAPPSALVIDVMDDQVGDVATFIRQFNAASLITNGATWAALTRTDPIIGKEIDLVKLQVESTSDDDLKVGLSKF